MSGEREGLRLTPPTTNRSWIIALVALVASCAAPPKPRELEAFERIKADPLAEAAAKRDPALVGEADRLMALSRQEWQNGDVEQSRRDALMGSIKLQTALALVQQDQARARISRADTDYKKSEEEYARLSKDLQATSEQVALLEKLGESRSQAAAQKQQFGQERERAAARDKLHSAELALKTADTVDARTHAQAEYAAAADMVTRAQAELQSGNVQAAAQSAELARAKAEQAAQMAKPHYEQAEQTKTNKTRDEALSRDAAGIPGVSVRLERRGDVARLVLPIRDLFVRKQTQIAPGRDVRLDSVAQLLKKYPTYPVQIIGHTDNRGRHDELVAISQARAQAVMDALLSRGVDAKRLLVSGHGPDEPLTDNRTLSGRGQNNRVEIVFLYQ